MAKKIYALIPAERDKECVHDTGFPYRGTIPGTGSRVCRMCGTEVPSDNNPSHSIALDKE